MAAAAKIYGSIKTIPNVFYSFAAARTALETARPRKGNVDLDSFYARLDALSGALSRDPRYLIRDQIADKGFVFAVVEGLDGSGKSSAVKRLSELLSRSGPCTVTRTPPASMSKIRPYFDGAEDSIQRAFYSSSNYIAAQEILEGQSSAFVICDRYYHSTVSWTAASNLSTEEVEGLELPFPKDLLEPDLVMFLDVDHDERIRRTGNRPGAENISFEETLADKSMAEKVRRAFSKIAGPRFVTVDGNRAVEAIAADMKDLILAVAAAAKHVE